jgi:choline dehydrogenase
MGSDAAAFVDPRLRVHGIDGLRAADASIMPMLMTGKANAQSNVIDERDPDRVRADA